MTQEQKATVNALLAQENNAPVKVAEVKKLLRVKDKVADMAEMLTEAGYCVYKEGKGFKVKPQVQSCQLTPEQAAMVRATAESVIDKTEPVTDADSTIAKEVVAVLEKLALRGFHANAETLGRLVLKLPRTKIREDLLNKLIERDDIMRDVAKVNGHVMYRGRRWYTAENIAESLNMPIKDVHDALYEALSEPGVKMRHCANDNTNFEYSGWLNILDVVRKFRKARNKPVEPVTAAEETEQASEGSDIAQAVVTTLEKLSLEGRAINAATLGVLALEIPPDKPGIPNSLLNSLVAQGDISVEVSNIGQTVYRGRRWYTIDEIAKAIPASPELVVRILNKQPDKSVRGRSGPNGVPEYSAWPSVIKVVREAIYKRRHPDKAKPLAIAREESQ